MIRNPCPCAHKAIFKHLGDYRGSKRTYHTQKRLKRSYQTLKVFIDGNRLVMEHAQEMLEHRS
jgi:hypothetical protein